MFTAAAILKLKEQGRLRLDNPVSVYLPWVSGDAGQVTLRQLLSHGGGIIRDGQSSFWSGEADFPSALELKELAANGGLFAIIANERIKYSNIGYGLLGQVIERVSGQSYGAFMHSEVVAPLGLKDTAADFDLSRKADFAAGYGPLLLGHSRRPITPVTTGALAPATGFYSSLADLCRFTQALYFGNDELMSDRSKREMQHAEWEVRNEGEDYGLGLDIHQVGDRRIYGHGGGFPGFITQTAFDPKDQLTVVCLTNCQDGPAQMVIKGVFGALNFFLSHAKPTPPELARFAGVFFSDWGPRQILAAGDTVAEIYPLQWEPFSFVTDLEHAGGDQLKITSRNGFASVGESIAYQFDGDGRAERICYAGQFAYPWGEYRRRFLG